MFTYRLIVNPKEMFLEMLLDEFKPIRLQPVLKIKIIVSQI